MDGYRPFEGTAVPVGGGEGGEEKGEGRGGNVGVHEVRCLWLPHTHTHTHTYTHTHTHTHTPEKCVWLAE